MKVLAVVILALLNLTLHAQRQDLESSKGDLHLYKDERAGAQNNYNLTYQRLELNVDPAVNYIAGKITSIFIPDAAMSYIEFDLLDTLKVDSVYYHNVSIPFVHSGNIVHITFPANVSAGQQDSVSVYYQGKPSTGNGFGSFEQTTHGRDSVPIIWTLSEPYGAKDWWPCKQDLQDKIDSIDIIITCPNAYRGASNGLLVKETDYNGYRTCYWKHRYPIATYLVCMAVSNYATYYNYVPYQGDTLPVLVYAYPEDTDYAKSSTPAIIPMIQLYDSIFGMYPFSKEKYGMVEFGWGGGMEHQTMTFESDFSFELMAHELGHHWFGDKVTCASWEDIWLNEGFAVYLSGLCYQYIGTEWWYAFRYTRIAGSCTEPSGSVWCSDTTSVGRIFNAHLSYSKGAMVLHMLRWELGDSLFFTGLKNYLNDINNAYSFANTTSLRQHLEAASGKDLSGFFYNWVYGKGYPSYQIAWTQDFGNHVSLTMSQTQSDPSVSFYDMPVAVQFKNATSDTTIVLNHTFSGQSFSFDIPFVADTLIFDPDLWIISAKNTITRQAAYNFSFFIYPNPTRTTLQMRVESNVERSGDLKIYNELGQVLRQNTVNLQPGVNFLNTDIQNFPGGVYRVSIKASGKTITSSFVVR